ncbi:GIY-YIG nuclease family protein [Planktothrix pseudagardhii]|uniref:STICHEL DnaA-N-like alpha-beta domain-containing protein n=1 Tax=Planktothrix pseudagardhii TaxID=132604 RepID=A0A9W4CHB0_9CYAN|nr:GIY-YIG nuclease family protein [Planktothrix pseudagardhii]CAD5931592.1 hypothetical protein NO713_01324 [Planktothrix pseudagardhii]
MTELESNIYLLQAEGTKRFKIERSLQVLTRNQILNDQIPYALKVIEVFSTPDPQKDETKLHEMFAYRRLQSDWFEFDSPEYAARLIHDYFRLRQETHHQISTLSQQLKSATQKLKNTEEKLNHLEQDYQKLQQERDHLFQFKVAIQRDMTRILSRLESHGLNGNSIYTEQSLRHSAMSLIRYRLGVAQQKRCLQLGDTVIMVGFSLFEYETKFEQFKSCLDKYSITAEEENTVDTSLLEAGVPLGIYFTTDKPYARLEIEIPRRYWALPGMVPELFKELKEFGFEARYCRLVHIEEDGDTGELGFIPCDSLDEIWHQVLTQIRPLGTQTLLRQQGSLIELSPESTRVGVTSRTLLKMIQDKIPHLESAFEEILGIRFCVNVELISDSP